MCLFQLYIYAGAFVYIFYASIRQSKYKEAQLCLCCDASVDWSLFTGHHSSSLLVHTIHPSVPHPIMKANTAHQWHRPEHLPPQPCFISNVSSLFICLPWTFQLMCHGLQSLHCFTKHIFKCIRMHIQPHIYHCYYCFSIFIFLWNVIILKYQELFTY